tara:strand:- start:9390 stop:11711 length:2322 start_codon:yes stop_codon:yes gene_type:complete
MADNENIVRIQTNFTAGEFDPLLKGRVDLDQYFAAADELTNFLCLPQGPIERRPGLEYIGTIPSAAAPQNGVRLVNFEFSTTQQYVFLFSNNRLYIYKLGVLQTNINGSGNNFLDLSSTGIASANLSELYFSQSADTMIITQEDIAPVSITRGANHTTWTVANISFDFVPKYPFSLSKTNPAGTLTPSAVDGNVTLTFSSAVASSSYVNQYVNAENGFGRARITKFLSSTSVEAFTELPFSNTNAIANGDWELESGYEDVWSSTRGYPRSSTFHEGRLYFGGSRDRPATIWGSNVADFFNFNPGQQLADEGLEATISTDQVNAITAILSNRDLLIFTTGGEFFVPQGNLDPIQPTNIVFKSTTRVGAKQIKPLPTENATYFIQRQGKQLREYLFADTDVNYKSINFSLFSSHLLNDPVDMTLRRQVNTNDSDKLIIINSDGTIACYPFLRDQKVVAPSLWNTAGSFLATCVDFNEIYVVVKRPANNFASCTITVTDYANIANGSTITLPNAAGTDVTFTSVTSATSGSFHTVTSNNQTATNLKTLIDADSNFSATVSSNVVTVTRAVSGYENLTVSSSDLTRLAVTNFTLGTESDYHLEKFDEDFTTDSAKQYSSVLGNAISNTTATGLDHIDGFNADIVRDDLALSKQTIASNQVTLDAIPANYVEVGIPYPVRLKTLPVETKLPNGNVQGFQKRITEVNLIFHLTQTATIDGESITFRNLSDLKLGTGIEFFTGIKTIQPVSGFTDRTQLTITLDKPLFFFLLGLEYKVSI